MNSKSAVMKPGAACFLLFSFAAACGDSADEGSASAVAGSGGATASSTATGSGGAAGTGTVTSTGTVTGSSTTGAGGATGSGGAAAIGMPVNLGAARTYVILAKSAISTVPTSAITGNLGVSPAAATFITGFSLTADATNVFSSSPQVTGQIFAANFAVPTPSNMTTSVSDMELAYTDAAGRPASVTELGAGDIGGM